jgi:hypothetical protein
MYILLDSIELKIVSAPKAQGALFPNTVSQKQVLSREEVIAMKRQLVQDYLLSEGTVLDRKKRQVLSLLSGRQDKKRTSKVGLSVFRKPASVGAISYSFYVVTGITMNEFWKKIMYLSDELKGVIDFQKAIDKTLGSLKQVISSSNSAKEITTTSEVRSCLSSAESSFRLKTINKLLTEFENDQYSKMFRERFKFRQTVTVDYLTRVAQFMECIADKHLDDFCLRYLSLISKQEQALNDLCWDQHFYHDVKPAYSLKHNNAFKRAVLLKAYLTSFQELETDSCIRLTTFFNRKIL